MRLAALIALALAVATPAHAQDATKSIVIHKVTKRDDLQLLAAEYYGDRNKVIFIMVENHMEHPRALKTGERLRIPVSRNITTKPGDTSSRSLRPTSAARGAAGFSPSSTASRRPRRSAPAASCWCRSR